MDRSFRQSERLARYAASTVNSAVSGLAWVGAKVAGGVLWLAGADQPLKPGEEAGEAWGAGWVSPSAERNRDERCVQPGTLRCVLLCCTPAEPALARATAHAKTRARLPHHPPPLPWNCRHAARGGPRRSGGLY